MRREVVICLGLVALIVAVYWPTSHYYFVAYDDLEYVANNPHVTPGLTWGGIVWAFSHVTVSTWNPMTTLSHMFDCQFFGLESGAHHLVNVGFHAVNAVLLFLLLMRMTGAMWRSAMVAALFALHPLHVESVAWISERKDVLSSFFFLLTLLAHTRYVQARVDSIQKTGELSQKSKIQSSRLAGVLGALREGVRRFYVLALLWFVLGLLSKPMLVTVPFMLLLLDFWPLQRLPPLIALNSRRTPSSKQLPRSPKLGIFNFRFSIFNQLLRGSNTPGPTKSSAAPVHGPGVTNCPLTPTFPASEGEKENRQVAGSRITPAFALWQLIREKVPFFTISVLFCVVTWTVQRSGGAMKAAAKIPLTDRLANAVVAYFEYLLKTFWPTRLAVIYPHPALQDHSATWPTWQVLVIALVLLLLSVACLAWHHRRPWLAAGWFWYLTTLVPVIGIVQVGTQAMADRYTYVPLIGIFMIVVWGAAEIVGRIQPATEGTYANNEDGRAVFPSVPEPYKKAGRDRTRPYAFLLAVAALISCALVTRHQLAYWRNTTALFEHALAVTADNPSARGLLAVGLEAEGRTEEAIMNYRAVAAVEPEFESHLAFLLSRRQEWPEAAEHYRKAVAAFPNNLEARLGLADALSHLGRHEEAISHLETALWIDPDCLQALNNLAWVRATALDDAARNGARAVQLAERACQLTHYQRTILVGTLAAAYAEAGRFDESVEMAQKACDLARQNGEQALLEKNQQLLEIYRGHHAYRASGE